MQRLFTTIILCFVLQLIQAQDTFIYVSDAGNWSNPPWQILKYDDNGNFIGVFTEDEMAWPQDILFLDSTVLISNLNSGRINIHHAETGEYLSVFASGLGGPTRMKIGPDNLLYVLQWTGNGLVKRYELDGTFVDDFTDSSVTQGIGLDWDPNGNLCVSSYNQKTIECFDPDGDWIYTLVDSGLAGPTNIWFGDIGQLYVNDYNSGNVIQYSSNGAYVATLITGVNQCEGIAIKADGSWLIGHGSNASVKHYENDGTFLGSLVLSGSGGLLRPNAVVLHEEWPVDTTDTTTSLHSIRTPSAKIVPQMGAQFYMHEQYDRVKSVQVWNSQGSLVSESIPDSTLLWNAANVDQGVYFIIARMDDGEIIRQRVITAFR